MKKAKNTTHWILGIIEAIQILFILCLYINNIYSRRDIARQVEKGLNFLKKKQC